MTARTDDYDTIIRVMRLYIDGFNDNDVSKFRQAFDEEAWIVHIDAGGALHKHRISEDFERMGRAPQLGRCGSIRFGDAGRRCGCRSAQL